MIRTVRGAVFDMDGTLVDSLFLWEMLWDRFAERYGVPGFRPSEEDDKAIRTMTLKGAMEHIHARCGIGKDGDELLELANEMIEDFYNTKVTLKPGVLEFLQYCKKNGIPACVASATARNYVLAAMKHCGIGEYFTAVLSCSDLGKGKEEPDIFLLAAKTLGTEIGETCVFEDSLTAIKTAKAAGMKAVGIYDRYNYGQEELRQIADEYIAPGETLKKLIPEA